MSGTKWRGVSVWPGLLALLLQGCSLSGLGGFVKADCRLASGEELAGSITFEHCH